MVSLEAGYYSATQILTYPDNLSPHPQPPFLPVPWTRDIDPQCVLNLFHSFPFVYLHLNKSFPQRHSMLPQMPFCPFERTSTTTVVSELDVINPTGPNEEKNALIVLSARAIGSLGFGLVGDYS